MDMSPSKTRKAALNEDMGGFYICSYVAEGEEEMVWVAEQAEGWWEVPGDRVGNGTFKGTGVSNI